MKLFTAVTVTGATLAAILVLSQGCSSTSGSGFDNSGQDGSAGDDGSSNPDVIGFGGDGPIFSGDAGNIGPDSGCANATANGTRLPVYMLIVLDGSGSMGIDPSTMQPVQKWNAVVPALDAFFDDLKTKADNTFGVGLLVFSDQNDPSCQPFGLGGQKICQGPYNKMDVSIAFVDAAQAAKLHARIDPTMPMDGTPTVPALQGMYPLLESFTPPAPLQAGGKKVVVLMTDGVPNDPLGGTPTSQLDAQVIQMAGAEFKKGITTFAVGIGDLPNPPDTANYDPAFMGQVAVAGGAPNASCTPGETQDATKMCHFQVTPGSKSAQQLEQDFLAAINKIRATVASCEFALNATGNVDPSKVNVIVNDGMGGGDMLVPQDPQNGWSYDNPQNPTKVIFNGSECTLVKNDPKVSVKIVLGCKTVVK